MPRYRTSSGLPSYPPNLPDKEVGLVLPLYQAVNNLSNQLAEATGQVEYSAAELAALDRADGIKLGNLTKISIVAGENLGFGEMLALSVVGSSIMAYKASNTNLARPALAICNVAGGLLTGASAQVPFMVGRSTGVSGAIFGATYYLGTAGGITLVPPAGDNVIRQIVGVGLGGAGFYMNISPVGKDLFSVAKPSAAVLRAYLTDGTHTDHAV